MYNKVSSSELKQNTSSIIDMAVNNPDTPIIVYNYNKPKVVIQSFKTWESENRIYKKDELLDIVNANIIRDGPKIDSAKLIRELRDEE